MIAQCPTCDARYKVADEKVSPSGTKFKCKKCKSVFTVYRDVESRSDDADERRAPMMKNCPHCGKQIPAQAVKCRWCRQPVTGAAAPTEEGFQGQESSEADAGHQDPFAPQDAYGGAGAEHQDPFAPQDANAFDSGGGGGAPGYGGPPSSGGMGYGGGPQYQQEMPPGGVPSYLAQAILVTLFCCMPFGVVSIVYAAQVSGKLAAGDIQGAMDSSSKAKTWSWVSFGLGLALGLLWLVAAIFGAAVQQ